MRSEVSRSRVVLASFGFLLPAAFAVVLARPGHSKTGEPAKADWKIAGDLEESCSCDPACPCWFERKPTKMMCSGVEALFIDKGRYGSVPLDGLAIAMAVQSPSGKSMAESMGNWNFGYVYVDAKASAEQRKALEEIGRQVFPPTPAERLKVRAVPITRKVDSTGHHVKIGDYGSFSAKLVEGGGGGAPVIVNPPMADPLHKQYQQGVTTRQTYQDAAKWDFSDTNYMTTHFEVTSGDYEKFAALMAEKAKARKGE